MSGLLRDIAATVKIVRIVGWREFKSIGQYLKENPAEEEKDMVFGFRVGCLRKEYNTACRALGLPDDWVYNETQLRRARCQDRVLRYFAIDHLVRFGTDPEMMAMVRHEKREEGAKQLSPPPPQKLLPGARP